MTASRDQLCNVCGVTGYAELIATCSKCRVACVHYYCMRIQTRDFSQIWLCEQCELDEVKIPDGSGLQVRSRMQRLAENGKVKFIPAEEVIKLSSGGIRGSSKLNMASAPQRTSSTKIPSSSLPRQLYHAQKGLQERSSTLMTGKQCGAKKQPSAACIPPLAVKISEKTKVTDKPACSSSITRHCSSVMPTGKKAPLASMKLQDRQKQSKDALISSKEHKKLNEVENTVKNLASKASSSRHCLPIHRSAFGKGHACVEESMDTSQPTRQSEFSNTGVKKVKNKASLTLSERHIDTASKDFEKAKNEASSVPSLPMHPRQKIGLGGRNYAVAEGQNPYDEERVMQNVLAKIKIYQQHLPAFQVSWKGGFQFVDTTASGEFYDGFFARPPCKVHRRAYDLQWHMPSVLQVKPLTRSDIWDDLFRNDCPDLGDIALYFFPSDDIQRSRKNDSCLFELMERQNLLLTSFIDGAELLIFTSKRLDVDSQDVINRLSPECLLLGVFRTCKNNQSPDSIVEECTAAVPPLGCSATVSSVDKVSMVPLLECTFSGQIKHDDDVNILNKERIHDDSNILNEEIDRMDENNIGKSSTALSDLDSTIQLLLLEFGQQQSRKSDVSTLTNSVQTECQDPTPISAIAPDSYSFSKVKTELPSADERGGCMRFASTFSLEDSQNRSCNLEKASSGRVTGIKKEPHY